MPSATRADPAFTVTADDLGLFTDLYELTMLQGYFAAGLKEEAVFSLFVRRLPETRNFLLACGVDDVLDCLERLHFSPEAIAYLKSLGTFSEDFLAWLRDFRFTGEVDAVAEGTPVFANEPILEVTAPIGEAQLIETLVMNQVHLQTLLASKAARVVAAAGGRSVIDFGMRRMHGFDASLRAARAFHIAGVAATSNVLAGERYGIPVTGTMAHSYVEAFADEMEAFRAFVQRYPETVLLVDTYDTLAGVDNVIRLARELGEAFQVRGVRIDSGDLAGLAKEARRRLDAAGLDKVGIVMSGGLDEYAIADLVGQGTPATGFGVGTAMGVSDDAPALDMVYKLTAYGGAGRLKLSPGKATYPGRKQVFRLVEDDRASFDTIARAEEDLPGRPLMKPVMRRGKRLHEADADLDKARAIAREEMALLPDAIRSIRPAPAPYPVRVSEGLEAYRREVISALGLVERSGS